MNHNYFVYITTNPAKTVLYIGMTNNLSRRIQEHYDNRGTTDHFAGKYYCYNLIYWERYQWVQHAIVREKELKGWKREKKMELIKSINPKWNFLNYQELT